MNDMQFVASLLDSKETRPVLLDIGAAGAPPGVWGPIASQSIYVGFDPNARELTQTHGGMFWKETLINAAVTCTPGQDEVTFYETKAPYCSSTLPPDEESLSDYLFADLFAVESRAHVKAVTLAEALDKAELRSVDWFKTDSQGIDLRLYQSLPDEIRDRVLAVDIEPGLIDAYVGEDLFTDVHRELTREGFWLSRLKVKGSARVRAATRRALQASDEATTDEALAWALRRSPGWCEARYLRDAKWLVEHNSAEREFILLWVFALLDEQLGHALDVAYVFGKYFPGHASCNEMIQIPRNRILSVLSRRDAGGRKLLRGLLNRFVSLFDPFSRP